MGEPRIDQINLVLADVGAAARFLGDLGVGVSDTMPEWAEHHRPVPTATSAHGSHARQEPVFDVDLDSSAFAGHWGGLPAGFVGAVLDVRVDQRDEVDQLHERAVGLGARSLKEPYDAFWGSRFATVEGPGPLVVGLMSVPDDAHRSAPPDPATFG
jgi:hypothetical protein